MGQIQELLMNSVTIEVSTRTGWDQPPSLYFAYVEAGKPRLSNLDVPDEMWRLGRTANVVTHMAALLEEGAEMFQSLAEPGLFGVGLLTEAWEVISTPDTTREQMEQIREDAEEHRIADRPDAVEIRCMHLVDRAGTTYMAMMQRGSGTVRRKILYPQAGNTGLELTGSIPDALDRMLMAVLGVRVPQRVERQWPGLGPRRKGKGK